MAMKKKLSTLLTITLTSLIFIQSIAPISAIQQPGKRSNEDFSDYVNMYIGTKYDKSVHHKGNSEYGGTMLMVSTPFGMTNFAPQTRENRIGAMSNRMEDTSVGGFIATHQPAVWMGDYGYVTMMPQIGEVKTKFDDRKLDFDRSTEKTSPDYYSVDLKTKNNKVISAEMTATEKCAIYNFQFPDNEISSMLVEASRNGDIGNLIIDTEKQQIRGYNTDIMSSHLNNNPPKNFKGYFVIEFNKPFNQTGTSKDYNITQNTKEVTANAAGGYVTFDNPNNEVVQAKIGTSFLSLDQAQTNLDKEIPDWNFEKVQNNLKDIWNEKLGTIEIEGASKDERTMFYTALYHSLLYPRTFSEDGRYYSPYDDKVHEGVSYTDYSTWDTFRAQNALMTIAAPERIDGMVQSLLQNYQEGGYMPKWSNPYYTNIMIGTHADSIVAEAIAKGFKGFDKNLAYAAVLKDGLVPPENDLNTKWADRQTGVSYEARAGLTYYKALGYIPNDKTNEAGSRTLEGAYDDWCIAQVAKSVGNEEDYKFFINRSQNYKNVYNKDQQKMMAKNLDGSWTTGSFTEGRPDNYNWCVLQDFGGYVNLMGEDVYNTTLDKYFAEGKNEHDNEPSHHYGYLYNYSGRPWKTQETVRKILKDNYRADELGLMGNDDCGQMSSWYVLSAMGFYPVTPASGDYMIGSPIFDKVTIHSPDNKDFVITANNNPDDNVYIESAILNGQALNKPVLSHKDIIKGGTLNFTMSETKTTWAADYRAEALPTYDNVQNPEEDYVPFIGDSTAKIVETNIALNATATADSHQIVSDGGPAEALNDGKMDIGYVSANNPQLPQYLTYNWETPQAFNNIVICANFPQKQGVTKFVLEATEDGKTWTPITDEKTMNWTSNAELIKETIKFDTVRNKTGLRMKVLEAKNDWNHFAMRELEVYNSSEYIDINNPQDVIIETTPLVNTFKGVEFEGEMLEENKDYKKEANIITLKSSFLKTLKRNTTASLKLVYNMGENPIINLSIKDFESALQVKNNIALSSKAQATSHTVVSDGGTPETLIDGKLDVGWCSEDNPKFPQYLTFNWDEKKSFNEIRLYGNYAQNQAPTNIDIEVQKEKDGEWKTIQSDTKLTWKTASDVAEKQTLLLPEVQSVYGVRIKINKSKTDWGKIAVREVEIMSDKYDVIKGKEKDLEFNFELNGCILKEIKHHDQTLELDKDYTVHDSKIVINANYLKRLKYNNEEFEFIFHKGASQSVILYTHGYEIDKSRLEKLIQDIEKLNEEDYTPKSWKTLQEELSKAKDVFNNKDVTQESVNEIMKSLDKVKAELVKRTDKKSLKDMIDKANDIKENEYTEETVKKLKAAQASAQKVYEDQEATEEQVAKEILLLKTAIEELIKKPIIEVDPGNQDMILSNDDKSVIISGKLPKDVKMTSKVLNQKEINSLVEKMNKINSQFLKTASLEKVFDLNLLLKNQEYNPDGSVKVTLKIDKAFKGKNLGIIYIDEQGNVTKIKSIRDQEYITFDTTHFSTYAIVSYTNSNDTGVSESGEVEVPKTNDQAPIIMNIILILGASIVLYGVYRKKRIR